MRIIKRTIKRIIRKTFKVDGKFFMRTDIRIVGGAVKRIVRRFVGTIVRRTDIRIARGLSRGLAK